MSKISLIILLLIVSGKYNFAQITEEWVARYNGPPGNNNDGAESIALDGLGNIYVTGWSWGIGTEYDYCTIKYNSSGDEQWVQRYNGPGSNNDFAYSIVVDDSGNVYVTGQSRSGSLFGTEDYATIKYNSSGDEQWVQRYNGPGNGWDLANSIAIDSVGNVYVTGHSWGSGRRDYATIKYNSSGDEQWVARYNGTGISTNDRAYSLAVDRSGNVYVTGESGGGTTGLDYATIKYNSSGVEQWIQRYNGPPGNNDDMAFFLALDDSGNVFVTGQSIGNGTNYDYATIKYNSSGVEQWVQRYNGPVNFINSDVPS